MKSNTMKFLENIQSNLKQNSKIITERAKFWKNKKLTEAKLTDYVGILQIRDILQKNPDTKDKEFAILDDMKVEVGTGNDVTIYKAIKNDTSDWELIKLESNNENENSNYDKLIKEAFNGYIEMADYSDDGNEIITIDLNGFDEELKNLNDIESKDKLNQALINYFENNGYDVYQLGDIYPLNGKMVNVLPDTAIAIKKWNEWIKWIFW